jgi:hypothetical protein
MRATDSRGAARGLVRASVLFCALVAAACGDSGPSMAERAAAARDAEAAADAKAREASRARLEAQRLAGLWRYQQATVGGGAQVTAAIVAADGVDADGQGVRPVQLVFRDHQKWGRSGYLVLQAGNFACRPRCTVSVTADDRPPERMAAWRPDTDEAIALFIRDTATLWRLAGEAARLSIEFPVAAGGTRTASFDVASLDESKMPGWSGATAR